MALNLYGEEGNPRTGKIIVAAALANIDLKLTRTPMYGADAEYLAMNPLGKIPALQTENGPLFESNAILRYVARLKPESGLYGQTAFQQAQVDTWLDFLQNEIEPIVLPFAMQVFGRVPADEESYKQNTSQFIEKLTIIDNAIKKTNAFLVNDKITIADLAVASFVQFALILTVDEKQRKQFPAAIKWFTSISDLPAWRQQFGRPRLCKVAFPLPKAQKQEKQEKQEKPKEEKPKQEQKPKAEPKPKAEQKPKEEKPKAQPKQNEDDDDGEKQQEKKKNPLDLLPASTFNIDDYKRQYFLDKDIKNQINVLFQQIDAQGWSLWEIIYNKAENEGKMLLITNNMKRGFLQRMDPHFRKYAFGVHGVYGEEPDLQIRGAWLWRGLEVPQEILDHPSYEYHTFNRIDLGNEEQKQRWANYWIFQEEDQVTNGLRTRDVEYYR